MSCHVKTDEILEVVHIGAPLTEDKIRTILERTVAIPQLQSVKKFVEIPEVQTILGTQTSARSEVVELALLVHPKPLPRLSRHHFLEALPKVVEDVQAALVVRVATKTGGTPLLQAVENIAKVLKILVDLIAPPVVLGYVYPAPLWGPWHPCPK